MKLRAHILVFLLVFGLTPLLLAVMINLPLVLDRTAMFYQRAYLQNLRADFRDLDQHLASRHEMIRLLAKLPEPGLILGEQGESDQIDIARARYTGWVNQILADQRDIIQVLFVGSDGQERFWLERDPRTQAWRPATQAPQIPSQEFLEAGLALLPGAVMVSRIRVDAAAGASDPRQLITLSLVSKIGSEDPKSAQGVVILGIDVGGLAQFYRDTVWVNHDGSYLPRRGSGKPTAFVDFPGLAEIFQNGNLALWKGQGGLQYLWVPMFVTEEGGRRYGWDVPWTLPIEAFRNALMIRVLSIILILVAVVMFPARWIAARAEHFGAELTGGISKILHSTEPLQFHWRGPREIQELGNQLTALAATHADHLRSAREHTRELERSNRYKSEFLANVSHELRTPLNSILLLSKMLAAQTSTLSADQRRQARVIHEAGTDLRTMIDNILDISRIEAGHVALSVGPVDLEPMLEELIELVRPLLGEKPVSLELHIDPKAPGRIYTDREKLRQILKNFLANATKFTEQGRVILSLESAPDEARPLALGVTDTGIGIPLDKQGIIFEAFQQADGSTRRRYGGTGLGLSISRELASLLGGEITVQSSPGAGARFKLLLPISPQDRTQSDDAPMPPPEPVEPPPPETTSEYETTALVRTPAGWVLIIDRDVRNLVHLTGLVTAQGLSVQTAADLDEALETLQEDGEGCILTLLAALMSEQETCDTIRTLMKQYPERGIAVVVVGNDEAQGQRDGCLAAGAVALLTKPVQADALVKVLTGLTRSTSAPNQPPIRAEDPTDQMS